MHEGLQLEEATRDINNNATRTAKGRTSRFTSPYISWWSNIKLTASLEEATTLKSSICTTAKGQSHQIDTRRLRETPSELQHPKDQWKEATSTRTTPP